MKMKDIGENFDLGGEGAMGAHAPKGGGVDASSSKTAAEVFGSRGKGSDDTAATFSTANSTLSSSFSSLLSKSDTDRRLMQTRHTVATGSTANSNLRSSFSSLLSRSDTDRMVMQTRRGAGRQGSLAARSNSMPVTPDSRYAPAQLSEVLADGGNGALEGPGDLGPDVVQESPVDAQRMGRGSVRRRSGVTARSNSMPTVDGHASESLPDIRAEADGSSYARPGVPPEESDGPERNSPRRSRRAKKGRRSNSVPTPDRYASEVPPNIRAEADSSNHARPGGLMDDSASRGSKKGRRSNSVPTPDRHVSEGPPNMQTEKPSSEKKKHKKKKKKKKKDRGEVGGGRNNKRDAAEGPRRRTCTSVPTPDRHASASPPNVRADEPEDPGKSQGSGRSVCGVDFPDVDTGRRSGAVDRAVREAETRGRRLPRGSVGRRERQ